MWGTLKRVWQAVSLVVRAVKYALIMIGILQARKLLEMTGQPYPRLVGPRPEPRLVPVAD